MKKIIIAGLTMVLLCAGGYLFAGSLDSPGAPATKGRMHTITDIHNYLTNVDAVLPGPVTGTASSATATTLVAASLSAYSDSYFNGWQIEITLGTGSGQIRTVSAFSGAITGTADSGTATILVDAPLNTYSDSYFNGWQIEITGGTGIGQFRTVTAFTGSTGTVTVATWGINPDSTSTYALSSTPGTTNSSGIVTVSASWTTNPDSTSTFKLSPSGFTQPVAGPVAVTGTADSATATTLVDSPLSASDDYYNGWQIEITGGTGIGQFRTVTDYTGSTKTVTVATWGINPDSTSTYTLSRTPNLDNVFSNLQRIPATGQATCYNASGTLISCAGTGQDGEYQKGAKKKYNKYAIGSDYVTVDLNTGLMWASVGNAAGCNNGAQATWANALTYCEGLTFAGYTDWRLPNAYEFFSIMLLTPATEGPFINITAFPNTVSSGYWTSTNRALSGSYALYMYFSSGLMYGTNKADNEYVRCVRGGQ